MKKSILSIGACFASLGSLVGWGSAIEACSSSDSATGGDSGSDATGAPDTSAPSCEDAGAAPSCTNAACTTQLGQPAVCVAGSCAALLSVDCPAAVGPVDHDDAILLGVELSLNGPNSSSGIARVNSVALAVQEINAAGGIPTGDPCTPARPLAFVMCDDSNAPMTNDAGVDGGTNDRIRAAKHLVNDLHVPVIIGASTSGATIDVASNATLPAKSMIFAPSSTAIAITTLAGATVDGVRLVWRAAPSDVIQAPALALTAADVIAAAAGDAGAAKLRLAFVAKNDAYGQGVLAAFKDKATLNGAPLSDPANATYYKEVTYNATPAIPDAGGVPYAQAVTTLQAFDPRIIVMAGTSEATTSILVPYETGRGTNAAPDYVVSDGLKKAELTAAAATITDLKGRLRGTAPGVVTPLAQDFFNFRYKAAFPVNPQLAFGMAGSYDITYLLAYALAANHGKSSDGPTLAKNMNLVVGGTTVVDVGPASLGTGFSSVLRGDKIAFNGASGHLQFDVSTGEAPSDISVWCIKPDPNTSAPIFVDTAGQTYSALTNKLTGTFTCQ